MSDPKRLSSRALDDLRMETVMGRLLQAGVLLAATVMLAGGVMYGVEHSGERTNYRVFQPHPFQPLHPGAMLGQVAHGDASAVLQLGILLLIATPICRVVFAVIAFAMERDRLYLAVSVLVLAVLLYGMLHGG